MVPPPDVEIPEGKRAAYACFWIIGPDASHRIPEGFSVDKESLQKLSEEGYKVITKTGTTLNISKRFNQLGSDMKKYPSPSIDLSSRLVAQSLLEDREAECVMFIVVVGMWEKPYNTTTAEQRVRDAYLIPLGCIPSNQRADSADRDVITSHRLNISIISEVPPLFS